MTPEQPTRQAGKGSKRRPTNEAAFSRNYEKIWGRVDGKNTNRGNNKRNRGNSRKP